MASGGDTITYTYSGAKVTEDISAIDEITIQRMDGADGNTADSEDGNNLSGGSGGLIENAVATVSSYDTLEIWVGEKPPYGTSGSGGFGRSNGGNSNDGAGSGGGSTELWVNNNSTFVAAADAGGGAGYEDSTFGYTFAGGGGGAGGVNPDDDRYDAEAIDCNVRNCQGGNGGYGAEKGSDGGQALGIADGGTLTTGGSTDGDGEITLEFTTFNSAPSIDETTASPTDGATDVSVDPTLSIDVSDDDGDDIDVTFIDESDGSQIGTTQTVTGGSGTASVEWSGRDFDQTYSWSVEATDGTDTTTSSTFSFTTTALAAPTLGTPSADANSEIVIPWTKEDAVSDGAVDIERATNGGSFSTVASGLTASAEEYATGTPVPDTDTYTYRVERNARNASATSGTADVFVDYAVTITGTNSPVEAGQTLDVDVDVTNNGTIEGDQSLELLIEEQ